MDINKYLYREHFSYEDFSEFIDEAGIHNVTKKDMDKIVEKFGFAVFLNEHFVSLYNFISTSETSDKMAKWTIWGPTN